LNERSGKPIGQSRPEEGQSEYREHNQRSYPAISIGAYDPSTAGGSKRRQKRKRESHAGQERQTALAKGSIRPGEHERENRQNAWADDGQNAAQKRENE
jgi:hypothetical protein